MDKFLHRETQVRNKQICKMLHNSNHNVNSWTKPMNLFLRIPDSAIFLWHFQEDSLARPDLFGDGNDGQNNETIKWAESWSVLKILRGHLQVRN